MDPNFDNQVDRPEELPSARASVSSDAHAALVIAGLLGYGGYIWLAARRGRQDDIELVALAWVPLIVTLLHDGPCAFRRMALLLHQGATAWLKSAKWIHRSIP